MYIKRMEIVWEKLLKEKLGVFFIFTLLLLIPNSIRLLSIFFLANLILPSDVKQKRDISFYYLPFSKGEIFLYTLALLLLLVTSAHFLTFGFISNSLYYFLNSLLYITNFAIIIFSISMLAVSNGLDNFGITIIFLIIDSILSHFGSITLDKNFNPYKLISITVQGNKFLTLLFAFVILYFAFKAYVGGDTYVEN